MQRDDTLFIPQKLQDWLEVTAKQGGTKKHDITVKQICDDSDWVNNPESYENNTTCGIILQIIGMAETPLNLSWHLKHLTIYKPRAHRKKSIKKCLVTWSP